MEDHPRGCGSGGGCSVKSISDALSLLNLKSPYDLIQLKEAYRRELKIWHPDLNPHRVGEATAHCQKLNAAYDLLESVEQVKSIASASWAQWTQSKMPVWEKEFKAEWRLAYQKSKAGDRHAGLHLHTCFATFKRKAIEPRPEWFKGCLFKDTPENRTAYREHLLKIAPNQRLKEDWARKYFALEFGESKWVFYLPASRELLTAGAA